MNEVVSVVNIIRSLIDADIEEKDIGVITPYSKQVKKIMKEMDYYFTRTCKVRVSTVDGFQGSERDYIIVSTVRSDYLTSFVTDPKRINVTLTRARICLIVLGNEKALFSNKNETWPDFIRYVKKLDKGYYTLESDYQYVRAFKPLLIERVPLETNNNNINNDNNMINPNNINNPNNMINPINKGAVSKSKIIKHTEEEENLVTPFNGDSAFGDKIVSCEIVNENVKVLWPDDNESIGYLTKWVNDRIAILNGPEKNFVTLSFDTETVCAQFGDVFANDFNIYQWENGKPIPQIITNQGIIVMFFNQKDAKPNPALMTLMKPLLEHPRITLLTFDFLFELKTLSSFDITLKTTQIFDSQLINLDDEHIDIISLTTWESLVSLIRGSKIDLESWTINKNLLEGALKHIREKEFPWDANHFIIQKYNLSEVNQISQQFLQYSANDIFFTALAAIIVLYRGRIGNVIKFSSKKLEQYNNLCNQGKDPYDIRQANYSANEISILYEAINVDTKISTLLKRWNAVRDMINFAKSSDEMIINILQMEENDKRKLGKKMSQIEQLLNNNLGHVMNKALLVQIPQEPKQNKISHKFKKGKKKILVST